MLAMVEKEREEHAKTREALAQNREAIIARVDKWRKENAEKLRPKWVEYRHRRMDAERKTGGSFTADDVERILKLQGHKCPNCKADLKIGYHVDHIHPVSLGGSSDPENLQMLCPSCNVRKSYKDPIVWANQNGRLL